MHAYIRDIFPWAEEIETDAAFVACGNHGAISSIQKNTFKSMVDFWFAHAVLPSAEELFIFIRDEQKERAEEAFKRREQFRLGSNTPKSKSVEVQTSTVVCSVETQTEWGSEFGMQTIWSDDSTASEDSVADVNVADVDVADVDVGVVVGLDVGVETAALDEESELQAAESLAQSDSIDEEVVVQVHLSHQPIWVCQACSDNPNVTLPTKTTRKKLNNWKGSIYIYLFLKLIIFYSSTRQKISP